jgi:hypothetical protein
MTFYLHITGENVFPQIFLDEIEFFLIGLEVDTKHSMPKSEFVAIREPLGRAVFEAWYFQKLKEEQVQSGRRGLVVSSLPTKLCFLKKYFWWPMPLFLILTHKSAHIKSMKLNNIAIVSLKTMHLGGIRTRVYC